MALHSIHPLFWSQQYFLLYDIQLCFGTWSSIEITQAWNFLPVLCTFFVTRLILIFNYIIFFSFCLYFIINMSLCSSNSHLSRTSDLFILFSPFRPRNPTQPPNCLFSCNFSYIVSSLFLSLSLSYFLSHPHSKIFCLPNFYSLSPILAFSLIFCLLRDDYINVQDFQDATGHIRRPVHTITHGNLRCGYWFSKRRSDMAQGRNCWIPSEGRTHDTVMIDLVRQSVHDLCRRSAYA